MPRPLSRLRAVLSEAHRRHVWAVTAAYATAAFVIAQVADIAFPALGVPPVAMTGLIVILIVGLPITVLLSWAYELTPQGLLRTPTDVRLPSGVVPDWRLTAPSNATEFIGRHKEIETLERLITDESTRLISIVGPGGMGKSRLALQVVERTEPHFAAGAVVVRLDGTESRDGLLSQLAAALGLPTSDASGAHNQIRAFCTSRSFLLVLDGYEQLVDENQVVLDLLASSAGSVVLVTTRTPLAVRSEHILTLQGLSCSEDDGVGDGVSLFIKCARRRVPEYAPSGDDIAAIANICEVVDGMPLGLELAAGWIGAMTPPEILAEIEPGLDLLETRDKDVPARQRSLGSVLDSAWRSLGRDERDSLAALAILEDPFRLPQAQRIAGIDARGLAALLDRSLLKPEEDGRVALTRVLRSYARRKVPAWPSFDLADAHAKTFLGFLTGLSEQLGGEDHEVSRRTIQAHFGDVRRAWGWYVEETNGESLLAMANPLRRFLDMSGRYEDGRALFSASAEVITAAAGWDPALHEGLSRAVGYMWGADGLFSARLGDLGRAVRSLEKAITLLSDQDDGHELAFALNSMGDTLVALGRYDQALQFCTKARAIFSATNDHAGLAASSNNLGVVAHRLGNLDEASDRYRESQEASEASGDFYGSALALNNMGVLAHERGNLDEARARYERALAISVDVSDLSGEASALSNLARTAYATGHAAEVARFAGEAREKFDVIGNIIGVCICDLSLGDAALMAGDTGVARDHFHSGLGVALKKQAEPLVGEALVGLAAVEVAEDRLDRAFDWVRPTLGCEAMDHDAMVRRDGVVRRLRDAGFDSWGNSDTSLIEVAGALFQQMKGDDHGEGSSL